MWIGTALLLPTKELDFHSFVAEDSYHEIVPTVDSVSHLDGMTTSANENYFTFELCINQYFHPW